MANSDSSDSDKESRENKGRLQRSVQSMIEQMQITTEEEDYRMKNFESVDVVKDYLKFLKCTRCGVSFQQTLNKGEIVNSHPLLGVLMCESCCDFYGDGNFSLDSEGEDKYCRWCGEGGTIFGCSNCICGFCDKCIKKHFGSDGLEKVENDDDWLCYFCKPEPLWQLRSICSLAKQHSKNKKDCLQRKRESGASNLERKGKEGKTNDDCTEDDSLSDSSDERASQVKKDQRKRKRFLRSKRNSVKCNDESSSSEDTTENQPKKAKSKLGNQNNKSTTDKNHTDESTDGETKAPKKRQKCDGTPSEESSEEKARENEKSQFEAKKSKIIEKLRGIWKLTEIVAEVGLSSSKERLKRLSRPSQFTKIESLEQEYLKLRSCMEVMSSSLKTATNSVGSIKDDLSCENVNDDRNIFRSEEIKLKSIAKKLQEDCDEEESRESLQEGKTEEREVSVEEEDNSKKKPKRKTSKANDNRKKSKNSKNSNKDSEEEDARSVKSGKSSDGEAEGNVSRSLFSDSEPGSVTKNSENGTEPEKEPNGEVKSLLKVKSFARMLEDNVLKKNDLESDEIEVIKEKTCEEGEKEGKAKEKLTPGDEYNVETETSATDQGSNADDEKNERKQKEKQGEELSGNKSSDEEATRPITRDKKGEKKLKQSFDKFRQKREKYLQTSKAKETVKSEEEKSEKEKKTKNKESKNSASKILYSSDSEADEESKNKVRKRARCRKNILDSSDEERKEQEGSSEEKAKSDNEEKKSDEESDEKGKEENEKSDSSERSQKGVSSGTTSSDEDIKKNNKWKRIRKKKKTESSSNSSDDDDKSKSKKKKKKGESSSNSSDDDDKSKSKKKKGRKNISRILKKDSLHVETKEALKNEEERRKRVEERQKLFEKLFSETEKGEGKDETSLPKQVILDFDEETKEPVVSVHKKLVKKLKPHQVKGVKFMWDNCFESVKRLGEDSGTGCILAHCMGLGKTLQVVTLVHTIMTHDLGVNTVLIVCPLSTVNNWINEFEMWLGNIHTDPITLYDLLKYKRNEDRYYHIEDWHKNGGVLVVSYDLFRNLTKEATTKKKRKTKGSKKFETTLLDPGPDVVICDEGHLLKNEDTALSKCMNRIKTSRRIVLTGTPLQNNLMEYHCMVQFVKPNILGTKKEFSNRFVNPINNGQFEDSTELDVKIMKRRSHVLHSMLSGCIQRFDYSVLTPYLPTKYEYVLSIALTETQTKVYRHFINDLSAKATGSSRAATLFNDYHNLQRIWTHPRVMLMHGEKESLKEKEEVDSEGSLKDFVVDSDEESSRSNSESSSSGIEEITPRKRVLRSNANDVEFRKAVEEEEKNLNKHWWDEFFKETDYEDIRASNKLLVLFSLLKHCGEVKDKVLVFSQSLYSLDLIEYFLNKVDEGCDGDDELLAGYKDTWVAGSDYFRLDGSTSSDTRAMWCKRFNKESDKRARLFLISTRAGGLGINLFAANRVVIFDASWNPSHDLQSIFRVYRFGQKKTCYIYRFLAEATMEEKIYERQVTKLSLAHRVVDEHQIERHYSMMNLQELYNFEPTPPEKRKIPKLPKDHLFADLLTAHKDIIVNYHEHDSLLENKEEEELSEEERKAAWKEYEEEKLPKVWTVDPLVLQKQMQMAQAAQNMMQQFPQMSGQFVGNPSIQVINPILQNMNQIRMGQTFLNPMFGNASIPLNLLQKGIQLGMTPVFNESSESFFNRVKNRELLLQKGAQARET